MQATNTIFMALQCCQCSAMQVKQRKKSSNKWVCVVCNQKQSVVKVFAQGPMAKDLRHFVQSFNMSRNFADDQNLQSFDPATSEYDINFVDDEHGGGGLDLQNQSKRRYDWTEYFDTEPEDHHDHQLVLREEEEQGGDLEPKIVTEFPEKEKFKRPKLRNYETEEGGDHQLYRPLFSKRNCTKDTLLISNGEKPMRRQAAMGNMGRNAASEMRDIPKGIGDKSMRDCSQATGKGNSKWKIYISDDDDGERSRLRCGPRSFADHDNKWGDSILETKSKYQMVEDDIHPDFI